MDAILLIGGKGQRMENPLPKPLVLARGKPILDWQLDYFIPHADKIILSIGYGANEIITHVNQKYGNKKIEFAVEKDPLGTAGGLKLAMKKTSSEFVLALNGDDITDIPFSAMQEKKEHTIFVAHPRLPFGLIKEKKGYATFVEKPVLDEWVSCGWYVFNRRELLEKLPKKGSLEYDVFPKIKLRVHKHEGFWKALNSPKDIAEFEQLDETILSSLRV